MEKYKISKEFFGGIIHDNQSKDNIAIDEFCYDFLLMLNSKLDIDVFIGKYDSIDFEQAILLFRELIEAHVYIPNYTIEKNVLSYNDHLSFPFRVFYDITYDCNLGCRHCFTNSGKKNANELTFEEKMKLVRDCQDLGIGRISIAGGEPFICPDFFPFIEECKRRDIEVSVTTNGTLLNEDTVKRLNDIGIKTLTISIDGGNAGSHDLIRGKGSFDSVLLGLKNLNKFYEHNYCIKTTIMKTNIKDIEEIVDLAINNGCHSVKFNCVREDGRAKTNKSTVVLTQDEYIEVVKAIEVLKAKYKDIMPIKPPLNIFCDDDYDYIPELGFGCFAGKESMCIDPLGNIRPCSHFPEEYICGNVKEQSLKKVWHNSNILKRFRQLAGNDVCKECESYGKCRGGCRFRAFCNGNINGIDPYCYMNKNELAL